MAPHKLKISNPLLLQIFFFPCVFVLWLFVQAPTRCQKGDDVLGEDVLGGHSPAQLPSHPATCLPAGPTSTPKTPLQHCSLWSRGLHFALQGLLLSPALVLSLPLLLGYAEGEAVPPQLPTCLLHPPKKNHQMCFPPGQPAKVNKPVCLLPVTLTGNGELITSTS